MGYDLTVLLIAFMVCWLLHSGCWTSLVIFRWMREWSPVWEVSFLSCLHIYFSCWWARICCM